jgi:hypothetical protein
MVIVIYVIMVICLIICICISLYFANIWQIHQDRPTITLNDTLKNAKVGDLLFFRHKDTNILLKYIPSNEFTHVGIIGENNGGLCVYEMVGEGDLYKLKDGTAGAKSAPLKYRLETYEGDVYVKFLNKQLDDERKIALKSYFEKRKKEPLCDLYDYGKVLKLFVKCVIYDIPHDYTDCMFCSPFIIEALLAIKIFDEQLKEDTICYLPTSIEQLTSSIKLIDDYHYSITYKVKI